MAQKKVSITYQEKYKRGSVIDEQEMLKFITENIDNITIEIREVTKYSDKKESMVIYISNKQKHHE